MNQKERKQSPLGIIQEIMRMSTEDGPGIRTTVFFKGCPLKCTWCHNPECISPIEQLQWTGSKCIGCKTCLEICPNNALSFGPQGISIDRSACRVCGKCADECPSLALELLGRRMTVEELADEVAKDRAYFEKSGGGITVSGGDPTMQAEFAGAFLKICKKKGLHTALDTCGLCNEETLKKLLPFADMVLYDLKEIDPEKHKDFTGHSNEKIFKNLLFIRDWIVSHGSPQELWVRTPIIPGATARKDNIQGLGKFIANNLKGQVNRWQLCAFNNLCGDKYTRLDLNWNFRGQPLITCDRMEELARAAKKSGVDPGIVFWSGSTRMEREDLAQEKEERPTLRLIQGGAGT